MDPYRNSAGRLNTSYAKLSPLQRQEFRYEAMYKGRLDELEQKTPTVAPPWFKGVPISIADTAE